MDNNLDRSTSQVVANFLEAVSRRDADAAAAQFADQIEWSVPGDPALPWIGARSAREEVGDYLRTMWEQFAGEGTVAVDHLLVDGDHAVLMATIGNASAATGRSFVTPVAMYFRVEDDRIKAFRMHEDSWAVSQAFQPA